MPDDPRVQELLNQLLDSGLTPEEVCGSCVELLPVVRERWQQVCRARAELDALFPPADSDDVTPAAGTDVALPDVPGYEVEAVLGAGGMGGVFRARHLRLNRVVALKMALAGTFAGAPERERFRREAEAVAALRHPNVVQVYDVGDAGGRPYFTMEYVEGGTLAQALTGAPLPAREAAALAATLAGAVQAAHAAGIVHRDLKPANVLLTADGVPKVTDFGLARRVGGEAGLTRTGTAVGTPSYMAPEQARGDAGAIGPAADVYALGAVLYELLTGRPPFRGESGAETLYQVLTQDPVPPSRLNGKVPRDLETVCLACLHKEPSRRYPTAAALADDLNRFLAGDPVAARPEGRVRRLVRRARRRPVLTAALLVAAASTLALIGVGAWAALERAKARQAADVRQAAADAERAAILRAAAADLDEMVVLERRMAWAEAAAARERAKGRLGDAVPPDLQARLDQGARELELVSRCDAIRLDGYRLVEDGLDFQRSDGEYAEAFRRAGLPLPGEDTPAAAAARIAATPIAPVVVAALDHWAACRLENPARKAWLIETAEHADLATVGWRKRADDPAVWADDAAVGRLIDDTPATYPSLSFLLLIECKLTFARRDPVPFLRRMVQKYPGDLWANLRLARALARPDPREAARYFQAALGLRPGAVSVSTDLAYTLEAGGRYDEALVYYRMAVARDPTFAHAQTALAILLARLDRFDEAVAQVEEAFRHGVRTAGLYTALGYSRAAQGKPDEAIAALEQARAMDPRDITARSKLWHMRQQRGEWEPARAVWAEGLATNPPQHDAWYGYAELCRFLGRDDEYRRARRALVWKFGGSTDPYTAERTARAGLLLPADGDELRRAVALAERAAGADRKKYAGAYAHFQFVRGLAEYRQGQFAQAVLTLRGDAGRMPGPAPRLVLAMALHGSGEAAEARKALAEAVLGHDWRPDRVRDQDDWIRHALRREAENLIVPHLPALLDCTREPRDNDERLVMLGAWQFADRTHACARLYAAAFAADPGLVPAHAYTAARFAARAGCGRGSDAADLAEPERAKWRAQAREWLRAVLSAWRKGLDADPRRAGDARAALPVWRSDPDLACLRDPAELAKLPADERKDCLALWDEVGRVLDPARRNP